MSGGRRVVVTGAGAVTPLGPTLEATRRALDAGRTAAARPTRFDAGGFAQPLGAEVLDFDARPHFRVPKAMKIAQRATRFAVAAATMALADARWPGERSRDAVGVVIGTSGFDPRVEELAYALAGDADERAVEDMRYFGDVVLDRLNPLWLLVGLPNMISAHVAIQLETRGPNNTVMTDWIAGTQAIGEAARLIQTGEADVVIAGGADTGVYPHAYAGYQQAGLFDGGAGFLPGEGAGMVVLEGEDHARQRAVPPRATLVGYATCADGREGGALARAMTDALADAGLGAGAVTRVVTASVQAEAFRGLERRALDDVLGPTPARLEHTSRLGHGLAAASPVDLALLLDGATPADGEVLLVNAVGYSRHAATVIMSRAAG